TAWHALHPHAPRGACCASAGGHEGGWGLSPDRFVGVGPTPLPGLRPGPPLGYMKRPAAHLHGLEPDPQWWGSRRCSRCGSPRPGSREQGFTLTIRRRPPTRIRRSRRSRRRRPMGSLSASFEYVAQSQVLFSQPCDLLPHLIAFSAHQGEVLSCLRLHELLPLGAHPVIAQALPGSVEHPGSL